MANFLSNCKQMESKHTSKNKLVTKILICPADCKNYAIYFLKIVYIELRIGTKSRQYFKVQFERSVSAFTSRIWPWWVLALVSLLMSSPLTKIDKDLTSDTHIRMTGSMDPKICTKMLKNYGEKLGAKFPATTLHAIFLRNFWTGSKPYSDNNWSN